ncbi:PPOX class F420-dependent oxidoreductase [Desertihabitans brevis]|uniref:PPOX class F420-dependent oxidoreductase n=1 Tax=Desertihabitans brevis TaxID=2268447 RepID=A0A367YZE4_9ACTN|nr:pyridoxamine 5'-phosphate oxidase family protein [Desertihabitans brevis]RCK71230.1 PPOX class F420-dependent oxidoreductase [Desertihabitans brevis]
MTDWSEAAGYFTTDAVAHLATIGKDGGPRTVPLWVDRHGESDLVIFTEEGSVKDRNIARDPRVALSVTVPGNPLSHASVRGEVVERLEGERGLEVVDQISKAYTGEPYPMREGLVAFVIRPTSWVAHDYSEE